MSPVAENFFKEVESQINYWADICVKELKGKKSSKKVVKDSMRGLIHSVLVSIDGGTALSDKGKALELINFRTRLPICDYALHEAFFKVVLK